MNSEKNDDSIPTLTQIIHPGDVSMENHFDASLFNGENIPVAEAQYFDDENGLESDQKDIQNYGLEQSYDSDEKQEPYISNEIDSSELLTEEDELIAALDSNEEVDALVETFDKEIEIEQSNAEEKELKKTIDTIISDTVKNVMPEIEQKLTQVLSQQIYQKLFSDNGK